jgi:Domain of unknown function (DUF4113)
MYGAKGSPRSKTMPAQGTGLKRPQAMKQANRSPHYATYWRELAQVAQGCGPNEERIDSSGEALVGKDQCEQIPRP